VTSGDADQWIWIDEVGEICKFRFANVRRNALPPAQVGGQLTDLNLTEDRPSKTNAAVVAANGSRAT
jgi:hypothetical protein